MQSHNTITTCSVSNIHNHLILQQICRLDICSSIFVHSGARLVHIKKCSHGPGPCMALLLKVRTCYLVTFALPLKCGFFCLCKLRLEQTASSKIVTVVLTNNTKVSWLEFYLQKRLGWDFFFFCKQREMCYLIIKAKIKFGLTNLNHTFIVNRKPSPPMLTTEQTSYATRTFRFT